MSEHDKSTMDDLAQSNGGAEAARALSLLEQANKEREEREENLFLAVPTWDGSMVCEYTLIDPKEIDKMATKQFRRLRKPGADKEDPLLRAQGDLELIARSSVGLYMMDPESGSRVALEDEFGHVGYDRIALMLNLPEDKVSSKFDAIRYLFGNRGKEKGTWQDNFIAISNHSNTIGRWMNDPSRREINLEEILAKL